MMTAVRIVGEKFNVSFDLNKLSLNCIESHCEDTPPDWSVSPSFQAIMTSQESIGSEQVFYGRFSILWSQTHNNELAARRIKVQSTNSGSAWIRAVTKTIWDYVYDMWNERNLDRHGRDDTAEIELTRQQNLREISMWYES